MRTWDRRLWVRAAALILLSFVKACHKEPATGTPQPKRPGTKREGTKAAAEDPVKAEPEVPETALPKIYILPLGQELPSEDVAFVVQALGVFFPHPVVKNDPAPLPPGAYYPPRSRYRAEKLLDFIETVTPDDAQVVMGLTDVDISTTKDKYEDWGILGLATVAGRQCVISRFRAKRGARDEMHTRIRLAKVVVHEVGHTLGLEHCPNAGCLMEDGKGTVLTTDREYDFCDTCRAEIGRAVRVRDESTIPWPRPA